MWCAPPHTEKCANSSPSARICALFGESAAVPPMAQGARVLPILLRLPLFSSHGGWWQLAPVAAPHVGRHHTPKSAQVHRNLRTFGESNSVPPTAHRPPTAHHAQALPPFFPFLPHFIHLHGGAQCGASQKAPLLHRHTPKSAQNRTPCCDFAHFRRVDSCERQSSSQHAKHPLHPSVPPPIGSLFFSGKPYSFRAHSAYCAGMCAFSVSAAVRRQKVSLQTTHTYLLCQRTIIV